MAVVAALMIVAGIVGYLLGKYSLSSAPLSSLQFLKQKLATGKPEEKEEVLDIFMAKNTYELIPNIIESILDDTVAPRHEDTGWGRICHQAASAMAQFAHTIDGLSLDEKGKNQFSFYSDVGTATEQRRKEVHDHWLKWWEDHKAKLP